MQIHLALACSTTNQVNDIELLESFSRRNYILMQNKALDELRRLVAYLCQAAGIALPNIAAMVGGAEPLQVTWDLIHI